MDRRGFVHSAVAAGAALGVTGAVGVASAHEGEAGAAGAATGSAGRAAGQAQPAFKLAYAPHPGMFRQHAPGGVLEEIAFMASQGFTAMEYNGLKGRSVEEQEAIGGALARHGMRMGVFVAHTIDWNETGLPGGRAEKIERFLTEVRESVDVARRVNATWMTVVPGRVDERRDMAFQTAAVIDALRRAAEILEPHGLVMVLEMLNTRVNHPGQFLTHTAQGFEICRAVDSPSCKLLYDIYHQQITEGNLIRNMDLAWSEIGYIQVGDNPGRNEPGTGEINYRNIFKHIHGKGYTGIIGMEHGNSMRGRDGERAVIDAYREADAF